MIPNSFHAVMSCQCGVICEISILNLKKKKKKVLANPENNNKKSNRLTDFEKELMVAREMSGGRG